MAFSHITSGQIERDKVEAVTDFTFLGSKITVDGDCSHEIKRCLLPGRKAMTNLASILKSRYIDLLIKTHIVKAMVFPVVIYGCESWTMKKAEQQRNYTFELWRWRRLLRDPCSVKSNQSGAAAAAKLLQSCPTLCDPIDGSPPGSPSLGFSRQEHWSGLPFPSPINQSILKEINPGYSSEGLMLKPKL